MSAFDPGMLLLVAVITFYFLVIIAWPLCRDLRQPQDASRLDTVALCTRVREVKTEFARFRRQKPHSRVLLLEARDRVLCRSYFRRMQKEWPPFQT